MPQLYYAVFAEGNYLHSGFNATSRFEVKDALLELFKTEGCSLFDLKKFANMTAGEICEIKGWVLDFDTNPFEREDVENCFNKKDEIEKILIRLWSNIPMDIPDNYKKIVTYVYKDVCETADPENWNDSDVIIGFRRWIESRK